MREAVAAIVVLGTAFIGASIAYQTLRSPNTVPLAQTVTYGVTGLSHDLFKG